MGGMKVDIEQVDRQIRNRELDEKTLLLILKNILTIQGQATALINPAAKAAAKTWNCIKMYGKRWVKLSLSLPMTAVLREWQTASFKL